jgi:hypothetical protein
MSVLAESPLNFRDELEGRFVWLVRTRLIVEIGAQLGLAFPRPFVAEYVPL